MRAGRLIHRVTIKDVGTTRDAAGAPDETLTDVCTIWSNISFISGNEKWANQHIANDYKVAVLIRPRTDLSENMQVFHGSRVYDIKSIMPEANGRKDDMILLCVDHG